MLCSTLILTLFSAFLFFRQTSKGALTVLTAAGSGVTITGITEMLWRWKNQPRQKLWSHHTQRMLLCSELINQKQGFCLNLNFVAS